MKLLLKVLLLHISLALFASCESGHSDAQAQSDFIQQSIKERSASTTATDESGAYMTAKIDGRQWAANVILPDNKGSGNSRLVRGERGKDMIQFELWKPALAAGKKKSFTDSSPAGIYMESNNALISGNTGEVEILGVDGQWIVGIFHFKASGVIYDAAGNSAPLSVVVTDGRFRVPIQ